MDEELKQQIQEMIAEAVKSSLKDAMTPFARSTQDQMSQIKDEVSQAVAESSNKWLDTLIEEADRHEVEDTDEEDEEPDDDEADDNSDDDDDEPDDGQYQRYVQRHVQPYAKRQSELDAMVNQLKRTVDEERRGRVEAETKAKKDAMTSAALEAIQKNGRARNPKQLLTLLQSDGTVFEKDGQFVIKSKDEYGVDTIVPLASAVDGVLNTDDYSHFAVARPGTGTGAIQSSGGGQMVSGGKWFGNGDRMPDVQDMMDPQKLAEMLKEVDTANRR